MVTQSEQLFSLLGGTGRLDELVVGRKSHTRPVEVLWRLNWRLGDLIGRRS